MTNYKLQIRAYSEPDEPQVVKLWQRTFPDDPARNEPKSVVGRKLSVQRELFLVGVLDGQIVGAVLGGYDGFRGWVYHLAVDPEFRRKGFGRELMFAVEELLHARGCPKLNLQVRARNSEVVSFYKSLGYSVEDHVSMGKVLK